MSIISVVLYLETLKCLKVNFMCLLIMSGRRVLKIFAISQVVAIVRTLPPRSYVSPIPSHLDFGKCLWRAHFLVLVDKNVLSLYTAVRVRLTNLG